ncbi:MAG: DUF6712 family protein [Flavobacteriaceae bacterium]
MNLLFNELINGARKGSTEIKATLGFLDGGFNYDNLEPDIKLNTPYLIDLIGKEVYNKVVAYYKDPESISDPDESSKLSNALVFMRLYVLSMAYLDYAPDNDLNHGNSGRTFRSENNEKIPWDWQVAASNSSIKRRAYKALDQLILLLDGSGWSEWTNSEQFKKSKSVLITNTNDFDAIFPINKSGQLYYRLVPFMVDFEEGHLVPILTSEYYGPLKSKSDPTDEEKSILQLAKKAIAYLSLGKALKAFPVEMFPDGMAHREKARDQSMARAEVMQFLNTEGQRYLQRLQHEVDTQRQTYNPIDPMTGLDPNSKHVSL